MKLDNPAVWECKKNATGVHSWLREGKGPAICKNCKIFLTIEQTEEVFRGYFK